MTKRNNIKQKVHSYKNDIENNELLNDEVRPKNGKNTQKNQQKEAQPAKSQSQENLNLLYKDQARLSYRSLFFYAAIFLCMLLFESQRFALYFERKSTEIPEFAPELLSLSHTIENIAVFSGIQASADVTRDTFNALSIEYLLQTDEDFFTQYFHYLNKQALFFTPQSSQKIDFLGMRENQIRNLKEKSTLYLDEADSSFQKRIYAFFEKEKDIYFYELSCLAQHVFAYPEKWISDVKIAFKKMTGEEYLFEKVATQEILAHNKQEQFLEEVAQTDLKLSENRIVADLPSAEKNTPRELQNLDKRSNDPTRYEQLKLAEQQMLPHQQETGSSENELSIASAMQANSNKNIIAERVQPEFVPVEIAQAEIDSNNIEQQLPFAILSSSLDLDKTPRHGTIEVSEAKEQSSLEEVPENEMDFASVVSESIISETTLPEAEIFKNSIVENFVEGKTYLNSQKVYDKNNSTPPPTKWALPEYETLLPDFGKKQRVLLIGDSMMMEGLGPSLQAFLRKRPDLEVTRLGRYSSGLSRPDFYNWPESLARLEEKHNPDLVIISLGANDTQDIVIDKKRYFIDTKPWEEVYRERTYDLLYSATLSSQEDAIKNAREVIWVSLPVMYFEKYAGRTRLISQIQEEVVSHFENANFINIEHLLTNEQGEYTNFIKKPNTDKSIRLRREDNIHVTEDGGNILAEYVIPFVDERLNALRIASVTKNNTLASQDSYKTSEQHSSKGIPEALETKTGVFEVSSAFAVETKQNTQEFIDTQGSHILPPVAGQANRVLFTSHARNKQVEYYIYLPEPQILEDSPNLPSVPYVYDIFANKKFDTVESTSEERFPVLYLLQGAYAESAKFWNEFIGKELQKIANEERIIIVAPFCEPFGWYVNAPSELKVSENRSIANPNPFLQIETFIVSELVPHIDALYPTNQKRALAGNSMGGHGAMLLGFKHPNLFSSVAALSGVLDIRLHADQWNIKDVLGEMRFNPENWENNSVSALIGKKWQRYAPKQILIFTGTEDFYVLEDNRKARDLLLQRQYDFDYGEATGEHDWNFWSEHFPIQLRKQAVFLNNL